MCNQIKLALIRRITLFLSICFFLSLLFTAAPAPAAVWYVDATQGISGNGTSWHEAFKTIQEAVPWAVGSDEVWVKKGVYPLSSTINLDMKMISIYGGFAGGETELGQRDIKNNTTTIDGQNQYRLFYIHYGAPRIDGFTLTRGKTGSYLTSNSNGGAILFDQCMDLVPVVINCVFTGNLAEKLGGAIYNSSSSPYILNCSFSVNSAWWKGGAIYNAGTSMPFITNCTFTNNQAGGAVGGWDVGHGGAIFSEAGNYPTITNTILWGNSSFYPEDREIAGSNANNVTYSDVNQDGFAGTNGNIRQDPQLGGSGKLRLLPGSPCVDAGNNGAFPYLPPTDYFGNQRIIDGDSTGTATVDMGAHEFVPGEVVSAWFVDGSVPASGDGSSWPQAFQTIQEAVNAAANGQDVYVRTGTYQPATVSKSLNFFGGYSGVTTIDAQSDDDYCFNVSSASVTISGFTIRGALTNGIRSVNSSLTVTNCQFTANAGTNGNGAAIGVSGGLNTTIDQSVFTGNSSSYYGGAVYVTGPVAISNSTFTGNQAGRSGGAIYAVTPSEPLTISNCTFTSNSSSTSGGAIYSASTLALANSTLTGNSATQGGGAIYNSGSSTVTGCTFSGNATSGYSYGGAIYNQNGTHTVSMTRFHGNTAGEDGGGIYDGNIGNLTVLTSIFAGNRANGSSGYGMGGGIRVNQGTTGTVTIINSSIYGNSAGYSGGGLFLGESGGTCSRYRVYNSILWGNSAPNYKETGTYPDTPPTWGCLDVYQYSNIDQSSYPNYSHNIRQNPQFVNVSGSDATLWDLHLLAGSPSIDAGSNTVPGLPAFDIDGEPRIMDGNGDTGARADMGVDEFTGPQDTTPPSGTILIRSGDLYTTSSLVDLKFSVSDPSGMSQMCISNTTTCTAWEPFNSTSEYLWTLAAGDGVKTVYAWFRDFFGNTTATPISDTIIVDTIPPSDGTVTATPGINSIVVSWSGFTDAGSGISAYIVCARDDRYPLDCYDGAIWNDSLETSVNYYAISQRYVRVCARDNMGFVSAGVTATATPSVDLDPPTGSIVINDGATYTNLYYVYLTLSASDPSGVSAYCISNTTSCPWGSWQTYPPSEPVSWWLSPYSDGLHTFYVFFQDVWGNGYSLPHAASITVDTVAPAVTSFIIPAASNSLTFPVTKFTATDDKLIGSYCLTDYDSSYGCNWSSVAPTSYTASSGGSVTIYAWARDAAGNIASATAPITITVAELPVYVTLTGNGGGSVNSNPSGLNCTSGTCSWNFPINTWVSLLATPDINSTFGGWSGGCSGSGDCSVYMYSTQNVTATFTANPQTVKIDGDGTCYYSIGSALNSITVPGTIIRIRDQVFTENILMTGSVAVQLVGGYTDDAFTIQGANSSSVIDGTLKISSGAVKVQRITVR